jgi:hypothetical protein
MGCQGAGREFEAEDPPSSDFGEAEAEADWG